MLSKLKKFFSSLKLAIVLFILIAVVSMIGTIINQGDTALQYKIIYGQSGFHILYWLGFLNIYDSWYFITLAALLVINLIVCSANRLPKTLKTILNPDVSFNNAKDKNYFKAKYYNLTSLKDENEILSKAKTTFSKKFGKPVEKSENGQSELYFTKNEIFRLSSYIVHISIIIIIIGVILNLIYGFRSYANIDVGQTTNVSYLLTNNKQVKLPFKIHLNNYTTKYYNNGIPKAYISEVSIINKKHISVLTKKIEVNHPLTYNGITIYQASYGYYKPTAVRLLFVNLNNFHKKKFIYAEPGKLYNTGINHLKFKLKLFKHSNTNAMPIYISLYKNKKHLQDIKFKLIDIPVKNGINKFHPLFFSKYKNIDFIFAGIKRYYYSGFQIAKNSYTWVVWMGCILMIISLFLSFYSNHKSMWIKISKSENKKESSIEIIFTSHKKLESIYKSIEKNIDEFKKYI